MTFYKEAFRDMKLFQTLGSHHCCYNKVPLELSYLCKAHEMTFVYIVCYINKPVFPYTTIFLK